MGLAFPAVAVLFQIAAPCRFLLPRPQQLALTSPYLCGPRLPRQPRHERTWRAKPWPHQHARRM